MAGMLGDGIDMWLTGNVLNLSGPQEARHRWAPAMQNLRPLLVVYLAREVWPGKGEP